MYDEYFSTTQNANKEWVPLAMGVVIQQSHIRYLAKIIAPIDNTGLPKALPQCINQHKIQRLLLRNSVAKAP